MANASGWTPHGHPIPGADPDPATRPAKVARCGGPGICKICTPVAFKRSN